MAGVVTLLGGAGAAGQAVEPREPVERTEIGGRVHLRFDHTSEDSVPRTEFVLRRARVWVATRVNDWIDGAVQIDMGEGEVGARFAFLRLSLSPALRVSFGQFKRAFDLFELTSSSRILVVERDGAIRGVAPCAGIGGLCTYSRFSEELLLSSYDIGVLLQGEVAGGRLGYLVSLTNGPGENEPEENHAKSASMRLEIRPAAWMTVGVNAAYHDYPNGVTLVDDLARAFALDVDLGDFDGGPHVRAGAMAGDNWLNLDVNGTPSRFLALQGIASWRVALGSSRIEAIEPVARVSWGDPNVDLGPDAGFLYTPGLMLHLDGRNKLAANLDVWRPPGGAPAWSLKLQSYLYF